MEPNKSSRSNTSRTRSRKSRLWLKAIRAALAQYGSPRQQLTVTGKPQGLPDGPRESPNPHRQVVPATRLGDGDCFHGAPHCTSTRLTSS